MYQKCTAAGGRGTDDPEKAPVQNRLGNTNYRKGVVDRQNPIKRGTVGRYNNAIRYINGQIVCRQYGKWLVEPPASSAGRQYRKLFSSTCHYFWWFISFIQCINARIRTRGPRFCRITSSNKILRVEGLPCRQHRPRQRIDDDS